MTAHILKVGGYNVGDRLLEGVMFDVHITEANGDLTIDKVVAPTDPYTSNIKTDNFLPEIQAEVQSNIDYLRTYAAGNGRTLSQELDEWETDNTDPALGRIDLLNEV